MKIKQNTIYTLTRVPKPTHAKKKTKKKKSSISKLKKECDKLWSKIVRGTTPLCQWCGQRAAIHAHHIFTRQLITTRHVLLNGVALCGGCHMRAHQHSALFTDAIREEGLNLYTFGYAYLKDMAYARPIKMTVEDYEIRKAILLKAAEERNIKL